MKSLPGRYNLDGLHGDTHKRRVALVNPKAAKEAGMKLHGTQEAMEAYANPYAVRRFQELWTATVRRAIGMPLGCKG